MIGGTKRFENLETNTYTVTRLLDALSGGRVRLPRFQRGFRWSDDDRLQLFDSIARGYPIGTLLLARGQAPSDRVVLGGYATDVPEVADALWVVDGQQRVATLATALLRDHDGVHRPIYFDLEAEEFVLGRRRTAAKPSWIPTRVLARSSDLNKWLREAGASEEHAQRADAVAERVREYSVPAYLVPYDGKNDATLKEIFRRVNRRGRMLESFEVFEAMRTSMVAGAARPLERVTSDLVGLGFGQIEGKSVERAALAVGGLDPGRDLDAQVEEGTELALLDRVTRGLAGAIQFLAEDVGCPHHSLLPYEGPLFTLARFFALHPNPHPRSRELLARWFWRGTISGVHRTDYSSDRRNWTAIEEGDEHGSVQKLIRGLPPMVPPAWTDLEAFRLNIARSRVELMALAAAGPVYLAGEEAGRRVPLASLLDADKPLIPWHFEDRSRATVAGYLLHPSFTPTSDLQVSDDALASHLLDRETWEALIREDTQFVIERRAPKIIGHVREFVRERLALDQPDRDRQPAEAYLMEDGA